MVLRDRSVTSVGGYLGFMGEPFAVRDPTAFVLQAHLPPGGDVGKVMTTIDEECQRLATDGLAPRELARTQARMATHLLRDNDAVLGRALQIAVLEQQRGAPELVNELPRLVAEVTEEQVLAAAAALTARRRASVEVIPGGGNK
jgi:predicted Zn-dependent peptidase